MPAVFASGSLTFTGQPLNTETVTIAGKVYTFQTVLTNVDGNVFIGATTAVSIQNLLNAINLGAGSGTAYAAAMTQNAEVVASVASTSATVLVVRARAAGVIGNRVPSTETLTNASWGAATLASGTGSIDNMLVSEQMNSSVAAQVTPQF